MNAHTQSSRSRRSPGSRRVALVGGLVAIFATLATAQVAPPASPPARPPANPPASPPATPPATPPAGPTAAPPARPPASRDPRATPPSRPAAPTDRQATTAGSTEKPSGERVVEKAGQPPKQPTMPVAERLEGLQPRIAPPRRAVK